LDQLLVSTVVCFVLELARGRNEMISLLGRGSRAAGLTKARVIALIH
jgi:hypothetical protein